ncbi:MAG: hypothetical protein QHH09_02680 [Microgenomates group bacterium]|nr:hypothetical protein [Microgenomates group bacterium]
MAKYVPDISSRRWVIISSQRLSRPEDKLGKKNKSCPFCPGNEKLTPPEAIRFGNGEPNSPGWLVRVFPNKYPITDIHEVIVHSPDHTKDLNQLPVKQIKLILKAYRDRYNFYRKKGQVIIFNNSGLHSGASLTHPHSQLVVIPSQINLDTLSREPLNNIVDENKFFIIYCPEFSQWPYELWISPKMEGLFFGDITDEQISDLAGILQKYLKKLEKIYYGHRLTNIPFAYNYYIYPKENWYIRIIPRFIHRAGFELGTGLSVNIIDPFEAARELRDQDERLNGVLKKLKKF